jgi:hypothetical protein
MLAVIACTAAIVALGGGSLAAWRIANRADNTTPAPPEGGWRKWDDDEDWGL